MLGVEPDASIDEMRARYRARARDLHPDHGEAGAALDGDMARLNAAWAVLRDPERRREYDRRLEVAAEPGDQRDAPVDRHDPSDPPMAPAAPPAGCLAAAAGVVPWVALLAILGAIFVFTAYAGTGGDDSAPPAGDGGATESTVRIRDLRGLCIQQIGGAIVPVDCLTRPHEGRIVAQASRQAECPEGTDTWVVRQQDVLACTEPGTAVTTVD